MYGTQIQPIQTTQKPTVVIHDTDLHGLSCGINALYALQRAGVNAIPLSHFSTNPNEPTSTPTGLASLVETLGMCDIYVLDIPIDIRNPKRYVDALIAHAQFKGKVMWMDHHGHSQWVDILNKNGIVAIVFGSSYDLSMAVPRMYSVTDSFTEKWALVGALADFDPSVAYRVSRELEDVVCDILDQAYKTQLQNIIARLGGRVEPQYGNIGSFTKLIVERNIEPEHVIEIARQLVRPLQLHPYEVVGDVVYTTTIPQGGLAWKTAWKMCLVTGCKVAIVPTFNPRTNQYAIIIARYWRTDETVAEAIEQYIAQRFAGRQIVGHPGARSIALMSQSEINEIPRIARELDEELRRRAYTPRVARLISDEYVSRAIAEDFRAILQKLTEILENQQRMYQEYLELKRRQVELLERTTNEQARRYD